MELMYLRRKAGAGALTQYLTCERVNEDVDRLSLAPTSYLHLITDIRTVPTYCRQIDRCNLGPGVCPLNDVDQPRKRHPLSLGRDVEQLGIQHPVDGVFICQKSAGDAHH